MRTQETIQRMLTLGARVAVAVAVVAISWVGYSVVRATQVWDEEGQSHMASIVRSEALRFRLLHPMASGLHSGESLENVFASNFLGGFTCGSQCGIMNASPVETDAYMAGVRHRTNHPEDADVVMAGYGYRRIEADGMWTRAQEMSAFSPASISEQHWWLTFFEPPRQAWQPQSLGQAISDYGQERIHVVGYLSPKGQYGHLGDYRRQLLVVKVRYAPQ